MPSIRELREQLQGPRRPFDTFYGKHVMRRFSIYLTVFFSKTPLNSSFVTFLSILVGLFGAWRLWEGDWLWGMLGVNGWYLLDHVDGELARLRKKTSATGLFFDTLANAIVQPLAFYGLGSGLTAWGGDELWQQAGIVAAYGSLMMLVIPFCVSETLVHLKWVSSGAQNAEAGKKEAPSAAKRLFILIHKFVSFPVILPLLTLAVLGLYWVDELRMEAALQIILFSYAAAVTVVWIGITANIVLTRKIDRMFASTEKSS